ncbi:helix-turn-helix domain-containing protein [Streptomyces sp. NPDC007088]|uniref:helix-turn-helix domain-containing protein n=1 Tax=Streptomyces sp. NPDC007088 TaxID=3364773 RepID=UPI0036C5ABE9
MGQISDSVWSHPELDAAVARADWGAVFRAYRKFTGLSQTRLGERVGLAQSDVSDIERGRRRVTSVEVRSRIVSGLGVPVVGIPEQARPGRARPGEAPARAPRPPVAGLALPGTEPDEDLADRLGGTIASVPGRRGVDAATLDWLDRLLAEHRRAEDTIGSRPLVGIMRRQLRTVTSLYERTSGPLTGRVVRLAAEHAQFLAWMAQDQGDTATALSWYDRSHEWALEAGDADMAATTLSMKAHGAWSRGEAPKCVRLAQAARWSAPGASPGVQGMAAQMEARGHAMAGEAAAAHRLLDEAQELIVRAAGRPEDEPAWMYFYDETWFTLQRGMASMQLRQWRTGVDQLTTGLAALPATYRRDRAWYRACLAHALAGAGEAAQSLATALATVPDADAVGRPHAWQELHTTASLLLRRGAAEGRDLVAALAERG